MEEQHVGSTNNAGRRHDPGRDREAQRQHRADPPCERGGEGRGQQPHGDPGPAARRGPRRREVDDAAERAEEEEQVGVGEGGEGHRGAVVADAADAEPEVEGEEEDRLGGEGDAAAAAWRGGDRRRRVAGPWWWWWRSEGSVLAAMGSGGCGEQNWGFARSLPLA